MRRARRVVVPLAAACCVLAHSSTPAGAAGPNSWTSAPAMSAARFQGAAATLPNDRALVVGGFDAGATPLKSADIYDAATNTWSKAADMGTARGFPTATALPGGRVLVTGGLAMPPKGSTVDTGEVYDPASNTWTPVLDAMSSKRSEHVAARLPSGKVLIAGGVDATGTATATADLYDPATNTFAPAPSMATARGLPGVAVLSTGRVLVAGGLKDTGTGVDTGETYDPQGNSWTSAANAMPDGPKAAPAEAELPGGRALVAGGVPGSAFLATADVYDATTNSFTTTAGSMSSARGEALGIALTDGRVLVAGGASGQTSPALSSAELFAPAAGAFAPAASMATGRRFMASARLDDGRVLAAGGSSTATVGGAVSSAEVYEPTTGPSAPGGAQAGPAIGAALLTWGVPPFDGGAAIERYRIAASPGGPVVDTPDARLTTRVGRLRNGQAYTFTVTAINAIAPGLPSAPTNAVTPTTRILSRLTDSPTSFAAAPSGPSARSSARRRRAKPGTIVRFTLIEPATVTFTVEHAVRGVKRGRRCVAGRRGRRCTRYLRVRGSFRRTGKAGGNRFRFTGRIGGRKLAPGVYRLVATPREATGRTGTAVRVGFRVRRR